MFVHPEGIRNSEKKKFSFLKLKFKFLENLVAGPGQAAEWAISVAGGGWSNPAIHHADHRYSPDPVSLYPSVGYPGVQVVSRYPGNH